MKLLLRAALAVLLAAVAVGVAASGPAAARSVCTTMQVTDSVDSPSRLPSISEDGTRIAFSSAADLTGQNADGNDEVFLYDERDRSITQLTDTASGGALHAAISGDGTRVAFHSSADLVGENADGSLEVFVTDVADGSTTQLTSAAGGRSHTPSISHDGTRVAFQSDVDLVGENADGSSEVFLYDTVAATTTQLTSSDGGAFAPAISADGTRIAFQSAAELAGQFIVRSGDAFVVDAADGAVTQLTDTASSRTPPSISGDGTLVVFSATDLSDEITVGNGEVLLVDTTTDRTFELTETSAVGRLTAPSISGDGTRVGFTSAADLTGANLDMNHEVFLVDTADGAVTQLTDSHGAGAVGPSASGDGTRVAFTARSDLTGENPDGSAEIFVSTCGAPGSSFVDVPAGSELFAEVEWLAAAGVTNGFSDGGFQPMAEVTRQAMAAFLYRLAGEPDFVPPGSPSFGDVPPSHPFFAEIEWLSAAGVSGGDADGGFRPAAAVSRQAMAAFLYRLAGESDFAAPGSPSFGDVPVGHTFFSEIEWLASTEVTAGFDDGGYHPAEAVTRQAMAAFMYRLVDGPGVDLSR